MRVVLGLYCVFRRTLGRVGASHNSGAFRTYHSSSALPQLNGCVLPVLCLSLCPLWQKLPALPLTHTPQAPQQPPTLCSCPSLLTLTALAGEKREPSSVCVSWRGTVQVSILSSHSPFFCPIPSDPTVIAEVTSSPPLQMRATALTHRHALSCSSWIMMELILS